MRGKLLAAYGFAMVLLFPTAFVTAESNEAGSTPSFSWGLSDIKVDGWGIVPTGPVLKFGYGSLGFVPGLRSDLLAKFGVGYESYSIYRDEQTRDPLLNPKAAIEKPDAQLELGFKQGLVPLDASRDLISAFAYLNGRVSRYFGDPLQGGTSFSDRYDEAMASALVGLQYNSSAADDHGVMKGQNILFEAEWGPSFLSAQSTDFTRAGLGGIAYLPLFDVGGDRNLLSSYLVFAASAKYCDGTNVPLFALEGTEVRGYQIGLDSKLRLSSTLEGRLNLPSAYGPSSILPVLFFFVDAGWYQDFANLDSGSSWAGSGGPLASVGGGLGVSVFSFATPYVAVALPLLSRDSGGHELFSSTPYTLGFGFSLHTEAMFDWL